MEYISFFVGAGFPDESLAAAQGLDLDFIGADAGTIDVGPYQLAGQGTIFSEALCRHDLVRALLEARRRGIPLVIGSCGGAGTDAGVDWFAAMIRDAARQGGLPPFRMARIYSEVDRAWLKERVRGGRLRRLAGTKLPYDEAAVDRSERIVAVMGAEPLMAALEQGADVVLAGRTTDSAIFAALPLLRNFPQALAWHAGKVAECGGAIAEPARNDLLHVALDGESFTVTPLSAGARCTPWSVAAHQLYENSDPTRFQEPSGTIDAAAVDFEPAGERSVRLSGARFEAAARVTNKLEGVEAAGFQSIAMASYNDPVLLEELPRWLPRVREEIDRKVQRVFGADGGDARIEIHCYGAGNGADLFGTAQIGVPANDAFFLIDVVAPTQQIATSVATVAWHTLIHFPPEGWSGSFVTAAWPFNPPVIERGTLFRFNVNHAVELDEPLETARIAMEEVA